MGGTGGYGEKSKAVMGGIMEALQVQLREMLLAGMNWSEHPADEEILEQMDRIITETECFRCLTAKQRLALKKQVFNTLRRYDVISDALEDPDITEIMVNGPHHIFVEKRGKIVPYLRSFSSQEALSDMIQTIVSGVNRLVNEQNPIVDARLPDGSRVNIVLPPVALDGPILTIRKFAKEKLGMQQMVAGNTLNEEMASFLECLVQARYNIFISGGTGSGKTTMLNALSDYIPKDQRVITIEDSAELQLHDIPNLVRMETRNASGDGRGGIFGRDLIKAALRMRPDRLIVGEIRDAEATISLIEAMSTGHDGSLSTGHANSPYDMLNRLETLVLMGMDIPLSAVRAQIVSALDIIVQVARLRDGSRKVMSVQEIIGVENGQVVLHPLYEFFEREEQRGKIIGGWKVSEKGLYHREKLSLAGLVPRGNVTDTR